MKERNSATALTVLAILYVLHNIPIIGYYTPAVVFLLITVLLYLALVMKIGAGNFFKLLMLAFPVISIPFLRLLQVFCAGEHAVGLEFYSFIQILIYPLLGLYVLQSRNTAFCKTFFAVLIIAYSITALTTIVGCRMFPNAARALTGTQDDITLYGQYKAMNIGDFHFVYFITFLLPLLIGSIRYNVIKKWMGILLVVLIVVAVYYSAYTTALLFCVMGLLLFFVRKNIPGKSLMWLGIVVFFLVFAGGALLSSVMSFVSERVGNEDVASRLADMSIMFSGGSVESFDEASDLSTRHELFSRSWKAFLSNPIIGTWRLKSLGGHSFLLDTMGLFGLLGLACIIWMYVRSYKLFLAPFNHKPWYSFLLFSFLLIVFQAVLNPQPTINVISYILPVYACLMDKETSQK